jgi:hypothetical protein
MNAKSAIEKLQRIAREKEAQRNEHIRRQEEEAELRGTEVEEELKRSKRGMLNIQPLVVRSPPHSSSECANRKAYNEKI